MEEEYYKTKRSVEEYIKLAKDVESKQLISKLNTFLPAKSVVLELGSGPGTDWKILSEFYNVIGSDNSLEFLKYLNSSNPQGEFLELDAKTIKTDKRFDGIYSNKVLHHLTDEGLVYSIERQSEILNPKGIVCHSFWKGEGSEVFKGLFVNYLTEIALRYYFESSFDVLLLESYAEFEENDSLFIIAQKK